MSKRSAEDKIDYYSQKIQKLQKQRFRRVIVYSSSSDSEDNTDNGAQHIEDHNNEITSPTFVPDALATASAEPVHSDVTENTEPPVPELDPQLLEALGDPYDDTPVFGPDIHDKLAQRWMPIFKKGMKKEIKEQLMKDYTIPGNCKLLRAPTLNAEISAAVTETVRSRDKKVQAKQDQLGIGITAINRAMNLLLTSDDKIQAVKILSDGCRILSDLHFVKSQVRTKLITPALDKAFLSVIQDQDRDETLFGAKLSEKIKASKVIEKQGLQIKKPFTQRPTTSSSTSSTSGPRPRHPGNWPAPPRFPSSSRGGHTYAYRPPPPAPYRRPPPAAPPATTRYPPATVNKRAKTRQ